MASSPRVPTKITQQKYGQESSSLQSQSKLSHSYEGQSHTVESRLEPSISVLTKDQYTEVVMNEMEPLLAAGASHNDAFPHSSISINPSEPDEHIILSEGKNDSVTLDELVADLITTRSEVEEKSGVIFKLG